MKPANRVFAICLAAACLGAGLMASAAHAAAPAWVPIAASGPTNLPPAQSEVQRLAVDATAGTYTLSFEGEATEPIGAAAGASTVAAELNSLASIEAKGSVTLSGGPGGAKAERPYFVAFNGGGLEETDVPTLGVDDDELSGGDNGAATVTTVLDGGPGTATIAVYAQNVGGAPSSAAPPTTISLALPAGVAPTAVPAGVGWSCAAGAAAGEFECTSEAQVGPGLTLEPLKAPVAAAAAPGGGGVVGVEVTGGGALGAAAYEMPLLISPIPAPPGLQSFSAGAYDAEGAPDTRAGAHPYSASAGILINTKRAVRSGAVVPAGEFRDIVVETPPGFFGNPIAPAQCPEATEQNECPHASIAATVQVPLESFGSLGERSAVNNIEAPFGFPAKFRFKTGLGYVIINVVASLRSDEDYGLEVGSYNTPQIKPVFGSFFTFWGSPLDAGHDAQRCRGNNLGSDCRSREEILKDGGEEVAFLTNPLDCAEERLRPPLARINVNTWQNPGLLFSQAVPLPPVEGCEQLDFDLEEFAFEPGTGAADSPASFTTELELPSEGLLSAEEQARINPTIRQTVLELPEGVVLNAAAAEGLGACSEAQIGLKGTDEPRPNEIRFAKAPDSCPDASKIGSGELKSALIDEPLSVELFLAAQGEGNPFGSLFAIYLVIENPRNGIFIKLPGEVRVDGSSGRQRVVFGDLPPLPFSTLKLRLKGGARSPLATPTTCGRYTTNATNTPWSAPESGPPLRSPSSFRVDSGPNGMPCANSPAQRPLAIGLAAGSAIPIAGAHSPFQIQITRPDGHQELSSLAIAMPPGFVASLRGIPYCSEAQIAAAAASSGKDEQAGSACPAASRVGSTNSAAGSGPSPYYAPGALYLSGPYKGAPLSVVAITPAVAGPFDLGNVVVRSALHVDPVTARITAHTDPLPRILKGVPLRIRDVRVNLDRANWAQNPTSCEALAVNVTAYGANGAVSQPANRFQATGCRALGFKPRTRIQLFGGLKRGSYQGVRAVVRPRPGDANIARTVVRFPRSAFVAQEHIRTVCTRVQFAADACPKGSIYGRAIAYSPLLDMPLRGNVYLRSSDNALPDAVADLRGPAHQPIKIEVAIRNDSVKGALRNTVQSAPDAPVSYFRLQMFGGEKGLIVNSRNICRGRNAAWVGMKAHNGRRSLRRVAIFNRRCKKQRAAKKRAAKRGGHRQRSARKGS